MKKILIFVCSVLLLFSLTACTIDMYRMNSNEENTDETKTSEELSISKLQEKYPQFFNVSTDGGFTVYIWQMAENNYKCYLINRVIDALTDRTFAFEVGTTIPEMRTILSTYDINKDDIVIQPVANPVSSYAYRIDDAYTEQLTELFWSDEEVNVP